MTDKLVPKRRFKGFGDDWEERKLGDIVEKSVDNRGKTPPISKYEKYPLLEVASLNSYYPDYKKVTKYVDEFTYKNWFRDYLKKDDILFSTVGNTGLVSLMDGNSKGIVAQNIVGFRSKFNNSEFIVAMLKNQLNLQKTKRIEMGAVQPSIKISQLVDVMYNLPISEREQKYIGTLFKKTEELITLQERKLEKLKITKQAYLEEMFPKENETVPKRRFKGFTDDWEQRKLGELAEIKDSARVPNTKWVTEGVPYLRSSDLSSGKITGELFLSSIDYNEYTNKTGAPLKGDLLFASGGEIGLAIYKSDDSPVYVQGGSILYVKTSESTELNGLFLQYSFESPKIKNYIKGASTGTSLKHFVLKPAKALPIILPNIEEQTKIGNFFKQLDETITLQERKLEKLKKLKAAYLSEMFV